MMNKKRLAALAMSAVMAAGTVSIPVNAADFSDGAAVQEEVAVQSVDVTEETPDAVGVELVDVQEKAGSWKNIETSTPSVTVILSYGDGSSEEKELTTGFTKDSVAATCEQDGGYRWSISYENHIFKSDFVKESDKLGHDLAKEDTEIIEAANCEHEGSAQVYKYCSRCDYKEPVGDLITLPKTDHKLGDDKVTTYEKGTNTKINTDGKPELEDVTKDGTYFEVTEGTCTVCLQKVTSRVEKKLEATVTVETGIKIIEVSENINDSAITVNKEYDNASGLPKAEDITLKDCTKDAYYVYEVYSSDGKVADTVRVDVKAHHKLEALSPASVKSDDPNLLTVKLDGDKLVVTNNTCTKDVKYTVERKCTVAGCKYVEKEEKVVPKSDNHSIDANAKAYVKGLTEQIAYEDLMNNANIKDNKYVKVVNETATCDKAGTVAVEFYCKACGEKAETITGVKVGALGHDWVTKSENKVAATCEKNGSYDSVTTCERCGKEESRKTITIARLTHTNESSVQLNGIGEDITDSIFATDGKTVSDASIKFVGSLVFGNGGYNVNDTFDGGYNYVDKEGNVITSGKVSTVIITDCAVCHNHQVKLTVTPEVKVKAVTKETTDIVTGKATAPGSITLAATYTENGQTLTKEITLPYYSEPMDTTVGYTGLHKDVDGVYRYYVNGEFDEDYSGIVDFDGNQYVVANGVLCQDASGLNIVDNQWYFLTEGRIRTDVTQLVLYDGEWFYVTSGKLDTTINGIVPYDGAYFVFVEGRLAQEGNGLWINDKDEAYWLADGRVCMEYTGVAMYDDAFFYIVDGKLAKDFNGTVEYDGATFRVENGQLYGPIK